MKFLVVLVAVVALASGDVSHIVKSDESLAPIVRSTYDINPEGTFQYGYETGNGIVANAEGIVSNTNSDGPSLAIRGSVHYTGEDGVPVDLTYIADENGYQPTGSHIPVPPPVPELILRSLEYISAHPPPAEYIKKTVA